jgi:carbamoyl-phosphate synthase large subunit
MVIPVSSAATQELSVGKVVLGSDVEVIAPSRGAATLAHDRLLVASTLWAHAVAVPHFGVPSDFRDVDAALRLMDGEFVLRARFAGDGRTATLVRAPGDLDWAALADDSLVQQFVAGAAYAVVLHRPVNGDGRLTVVLEKTIRADGEVVTSRVKESRAVGSVERVAQAAIRALGLTGPAEVMIRSTADGSPVVLDVSAGFGPHTRMVPELIDVVLRSHRTASTDFTRECVAAESGRRQAGGRR